MDALFTGLDYNELPDTYVIFICDYDPIGMNLYRYTIANQCIENGQIISDGNHTIWLSTKGQNACDEPESLVEFLQYVGNPEQSKDTQGGGTFVASLKKQIAAIKRNRDWEAKFMLFEEMLKDEREEGRREGEERLNRLTRLLAEQNRIDDIVKAASDIEFQNQLFKEFNL